MGVFPSQFLLRFLIKHKFIFFLIVFQLLVISFFCVYIYKKKNSYSINISLTSSGKKEKSSNSIYKYYYDLPNNITLDGNKPNGITIPWLNSKVDYSINDDGLNERFNYSLNKPTNICSRIVVLGDSFTFGLYVNTNSNYTEILEDELNAIKASNKYEVINLGVYGYDINYSIERFRLKGKKYNPDLIIFLLKDDDFIEDNEIEQSIKINLTKTMKQDGSYYKSNSACPECAKLMEKMEQYNKTFGEEKMLQEKENSIKQIRRYYTGKILFVTFPQINEKYKNILEKLTKSDHNMFLAYITNTIMDNSMNFLPYDYHPNIKGHMTIARDIESYLMRNNILSCK